MGTLQADDDTQQELDDSGCVYDESPSSKQARNGYIGQAELLDLSDDVLLYILKHCSPRDLKALGYTCPRLGSLILDHTLWQKVDARSQPSGRARLRWLLAHALNAGTKELMLSGYAREAKGCLGLINHTRDEAVMEPHRCESEESDDDLIENGGGDNEADRSAEGSARQVPPYPLIRQHARLHFAETLPRFTGTPCWSELPEGLEATEAAAEGCGGPQFTLTQSMLSQLRAQCTELTELRLEYCNIDCKATGISQLPPTLRRLSLRGVKCYNLPLDKSFLFRIADYLPHLQYLDVSECDWLEPASLLPISKMTSLEHLLMRNCYKLSEFVAYASLACRYGFTNLKILDLRGSPVGDAEVSALGWVSGLQELYLSPAPPSTHSSPIHKHYKGEPISKQQELDQWEIEEPEYFKTKGEAPSPSSSGGADTSSVDLEEQIETLRRRRLKLHHTDLSANADQCRVVQNMESDDEGAKSRYSLEHEAAQPEAARLEVKQPPVEKDGNSSKRKAENESDNYVAVPGPSFKRKKEENAGENNVHNGKKKADSDSSDVSNLGASTSKLSEPEAKTSEEPTSSDNPKSPTKQESDSDDSEEAPKPKLEKYVRFRQNRDPVVVHYAAQPERIEAEPRQHILYVNVGQQLQAMYRMLPGQLMYERRNPSMRQVFNPYSSHVDSASLVTDTAIRRFGRAEGEDIYVVHIGPNGPLPARLREQSRPNRSILRVLSITGYRHVTDRSLIHLATAAPHLRLLDMRGTSITELGVLNFKSLRQDCEIRHSSYFKKDDGTEDM